MTTNAKRSLRTSDHYVYLYRDNAGRARYIGYGRATDRATSHLVGSHSQALKRFLAERRYRLEIAGPFAAEATGRAVETALISALKPEFNRDFGPAKWRFRPLGVPPAYAERLTAPQLSRADFLKVQGSARAPVLFVIITDAALENRVGYNPANPPTEDQIRERVDHWWQLQRFVPTWSARANTSPGLLVGVFGSPGRQIVIASTRIARDKWAAAEQGGNGTLRVPLIDPTDLDAYKLRGRHVARTAGLRFGGIRSQFCILLRTNGTLAGGQPPS